MNDKMVDPHFSFYFERTRVFHVMQHVVILRSHTTGCKFSLYRIPNRVSPLISVSSSLTVEFISTAGS